MTPAAGVKRAIHLVSWSCVSSAIADLETRCQQSRGAFPCGRHPSYGFKETSIRNFGLAPFRWPRRDRNRRVGCVELTRSRDDGILTDSFRCSLRLLERLLAAIPSPLSFPPFWRASSTSLALIEADGDEPTMNFVVVFTNLKSDLTRFYAKESVLNNELRRTPL